MASRYKDFGAVDEPEYEFENPKDRIPVMARVKVWKKGLEHPTVGIAYWDEYSPANLDDAKAFMWKKMPKLMLAKCAEALALRKAYPDLSDIYTDEEMAQHDQDYTPGGRQITDAAGFAPSGRPVTYSAQTGSHEAAVEAGKRVAEDLKAKMDARQAGSPAPATPKPPAPPTKGTVTFDFSKQPAEPFIIIGGDLGDVSPVFEKNGWMKWHNEQWIASERGCSDIEMWCKENGYAVKTIASHKQVPAGKPGNMNPSPPAGKAAAKAQGRGSSAPAAAKPELDWVEGEIEQANPQSGKSPRLDVLLKVGKVKHWMSAWDQKLFPALSAAKGKTAVLIVKRNVKGDKTYTNIIGFKRIGATEYDEDGFTPVIQNKTREAGGKTLWG
jgi:hypothetical protein